MTLPRRPEDELAELQARRAPQFEAALRRLATRRAAGQDPAAALAALARLLRETMALADMYGRRRLLLEAGRPARRPGLGGAFAATPIVPKVPFEEAIEDIIRREPRLASSGEEVARAYSEEHAFALAYSADRHLTERIQEYVARAMREGRTVDQARNEITGIAGPYRETGGALREWTRAYSETVYRTNLATAYSAGRLRMARDPDVKDLVGAWEYRAVLDSDVRPNHRAAHGLIAPVDDPIWEVFTPPISWNCRCSLRMVGPEEARRRGATASAVPPAGFSAARPDPGFGAGRPDRRIYR